jgi:glycyl-tRNA synthetase beta chain
MGDKTRRIRELSKTIAKAVHVVEKKMEEIDRAAKICKFDLVTHMVDEFSELQGIMGEKYARLAGEPEDVAKAINEHYRPRFKGDHLPETDTGAIVGIADKLDTIVGCFVIGLIPSGSADPYALRRGASGIVQILFYQGWDIPIETLLEEALNVYEKAGIIKQNRENVLEQLGDFFRSRMKTMLQERNIAYDVIDAVLTEEINSVDYLVARAELLTEKRTKPEFKSLVEALSRVTNIARKADFHETNVDPSLFAEDQERELHDAAMKVEKQVRNAANEKEPLQAYQALFSLREPINQYFDHIMVMAKDERLRNNRLKQMNVLSQVIRSFADFNAIVI